MRDAVRKIHKYVQNCKIAFFFQKKHENSEIVDFCDKSQNVQNISFERNTVLWGNKNKI